jgi:hypothetical protein
MLEKKRRREISQRRFFSASRIGWFDGASSSR